MTIMTSIHRTTSDIAKSVRSDMESVRHGLGAANARVVNYVKDNPGTCLLGALAVGFIVGRIASR